MKLNNDKRFYMYPNGKRKSILLSTLRKLFHIDEEELFVSIHNDLYEISNKGRIFDNENMQYLEPYLKEGEYYVNLNENENEFIQPCKARPSYKVYSVKELIETFC